MVALALVSWDFPWEAVNTRADGLGTVMSTTGDTLLDLGSMLVDVAHGASSARGLAFLASAECSSFVSTWNTFDDDGAVFVRIWPAYWDGSQNFTRIFYAVCTAMCSPHRSEVGNTPVTTPSTGVPRPALWSVAFGAFDSVPKSLATSVDDDNVPLLDTLLRNTGG